MDKHPARQDRDDKTKRHEKQPTWRKTTPRGNPEVHRADLERSTERLEMLLGH